MSQFPDCLCVLCLPAFSAVTYVVRMETTIIVSTVRAI